MFSLGLSVNAFWGFILQEIVGILKWYMELKPHQSPDALRSSLDVMRFMARTGVADAYPEHFAVVKAHCDETLTAVLGNTATPPHSL